MSIARNTITIALLSILSTSLYADDGGLRFSERLMNSARSISGADQASSTHNKISPQINDQETQELAVHRSEDASVADLSQLKNQQDK